MTGIQNPSERKKLIWAGVLGVLAIVLLWWAFFGFGSSATKTPPRADLQQTIPAVNSGTPQKDPTNQVVELRADMLDQLRPVNYQYSLPAVPEARRNIFVYYEPPKPVLTASVPTPPPTPPPPVLLARLSPSNVFARTGDFALEVSGDKFTPQLRVIIDSSELPTRYIGPQQLTAAVPALLIANPGTREVLVRSPDGKLFSNSSVLNVSPPPTPNYNYVGIIGTKRYIDTAILQDKNNKEMLNVQRGDLLGGRFRITSISEKELVLMDTTLKIRHTLAFTSQSERGNPLLRPTPRPETEDDEP